VPAPLPLLAKQHLCLRHCRCLPSRIAHLPLRNACCIGSCAEAASCHTAGGDEPSPALSPAIYSDGGEIRDRSNRTDMANDLRPDVAAEHVEPAAHCVIVRSWLVVLSVPPPEPVTDSPASLEPAASTPAALSPARTGAHRREGHCSMPCCRPKLRLCHKNCHYHAL
jgi:hypothetical protein